MLINTFYLSHSFFTNRFEIVKESMTEKELIKNSDIIAHIKPSLITRTNKYMTFSHVDTVQSYSDKMIEKDALVILPSGIDTENEYLVFLRYEDGLYIVTSKTGSVIPKNNKEKWDEILKLLEY